MATPTRREFLGQSALGAGVLGLSASQIAQAQEKPAEMCIARWKGEAPAIDKLDAMATKLTEEALGAIGGIERFVSKGDVVWVKPNMAWDRTPEQAANTHPAIVGTIVRLCLAAGAKQVKVGDNTCNHPKKSYAKSGIAAAVKAAGGEVHYVDRKRFRDMEIGGKVLKNSPVYPEMVEADIMINCPVVKHHSLAKVTICMKNYMGVVENRRRFHQDIPGCLRDITAFMKPKVCVLDATRILTANGPTGGDMKDVKQLNTIAAGTDIVALDAFGAELLGHRPQDIETVVAGHEGGLGEIDYHKLNLRELEVA